MNTKRINMFFIGLIILNALLDIYLIKKINYYKVRIEQINIEEKQKTKIKEIKSEEKKYYGENIVFLGDSITDWYPFEGLYEDNIPIINSGRAGYRTFSILEEMETLVYQYNPTKVFVLIGTNDLNTNTGVDQLLKNIEKIIKGIEKNRPKCKIYVQSIYPVNRTDDDKIDMDKVSKRENDEIKQVNKEIKKICKKYDVDYIDVYKHLVDDDGSLALKYTKDGLHLSDLGYLKVTKVLTPYVEE